MSINIENYVQGGDCRCNANGECECGCGADWTPKEVYVLGNKVEQQQAEIKARNDVLTQFINRFDSTNDEQQETYQAAISLLNKHLIKS